MYLLSYWNVEENTDIDYRRKTDDIQESIGNLKENTLAFYYLGMLLQYLSRLAFKIIFEHCSGLSWLIV